MYNIYYFISLLEILRVTGKSDLKDRGEYSGQSENDHERDREDGEKKPRYRTYAGAIVTEEVVKLSEKVVVPVKEYPKVSFCNF